MCRILPLLIFAYVFSNHVKESIAATYPVKVSHGTSITEAQELLPRLSTSFTDDESMFCAAINPITGNYIDLSPLSTKPNKVGPNVLKNHERSQVSWFVRGWQYETNFTVSICSPSILDAQHSNKTGAHYIDEDGHVISIGDFNTTPTFTGSKIKLQYSNGDLCPNGVDYRTSLFNLVCDHNIQSNAQIDLIGIVNNCTYIFEVLSIYACPRSSNMNNINLLAIFFGIFLVFFAVEFFRRCFCMKLNTQLRQMPNNYIPVSENPRPLWATVESEPRWRTFIRTCFTTANDPHTLIKLNSAQKSRTSSADLNSQSSVPSSSSLFREIETQNNLLDDLEVHSSHS